MKASESRSSAPPVTELPVLGRDPVERVDAARNRLKILAAAADLFERFGCENVSMDAVAAAASVGKGTLYRRFGDRAGLARAIIDEHEREFQEAMIRGEPPLGPGAAPAERLVAFAAAALDQLDRHGDLILAAQTGTIGARFHGSVYAAHRAHVHALVRELNPELDADYFSEVLMAPLAAEFVNYWRGERELNIAELLPGFRQLVERLSR